MGWLSVKVRWVRLGKLLSSCLKLCPNSILMTVGGILGRGTLKEAETRMWVTGVVWRIWKSEGVLTSLYFVGVNMRLVFLSMLRRRCMEKKKEVDRWDFKTVKACRHVWASTKRVDFGRYCN
jgi:hypothetical protein